jgi:hypothetical protein
MPCGFGPEPSPTHEPGHPMPAHVAPCSAQLLVDPQGSVEAAMLPEHRRDLSGDRRVLGRTHSRRLLPLPPGVEATAGHTQLPAQPGHRVATWELIDQAKPLGGSAPAASGSPSGQGNVRCRQPEKIFLPPELSNLLAEPVELGSLLAGEQALVARTDLAAIHASLPHPAGQAAGRKAELLSNGVAGEALLQAELHGLRFLLRREAAQGSGGVDHQWTLWWSWRDP